MRANFNFAKHYQEEILLPFSKKQNHEIDVYVDLFFHDNVTLNGVN